MSDNEIPVVEQPAYKSMAAKILEECIQSLGAVPSGHLYAMLMSTWSLTFYQSILDILVEQKKIKIAKSHMITWIGEKK